ncbi:MAG: EFR1 family ferrodoxin [Candidatus Aminicenantes bacterium]|nr:EFR1 family ferrodoxin [Candidatus Aminicenantes bacterium]
MKDFSSNYKNILVYYFSGTGNAKFAAEEIALLAEKKGVSAKVIKLVDEKPDLSVTDENTLIGFCYPTHGFNAPPVVLKYIVKFPKGKSDIFLLNTRAGMKLFKFQTPGLGGMALWLPAIILKFKGYKIRGFRPLDMPSNWITIHPGLIKSAVNFIAEKCKITLSKFTNRILLRKRVLSGFFWLPVDIMLFPISIGYYFFGRFALAKTLFASYKCNNCGICIEKCPVNAISMKNRRPYWSFKCESCMQCINNCPKRAIESSIGINAIVWWLVFSLVPHSLIGYLVDQQVISKGFYLQYSRLIFYIIMVVSGFALLFSGYWILHQLLRIKLFNRIITVTSLTHFKFWNRYMYRSKKEVE